MINSDSTQNSVCNYMHFLYYMVPSKQCKRYYVCCGGKKLLFKRLC